MLVDGFEFDDWTKMVFVAIDDIIPEISCVYFLMNDDELVYIGQTRNLRNRISGHKINLRYNIKVGNDNYGDDFFNSLFYLPVEDDRVKRLELEKYYIDKYEPKLNYMYDMGYKMLNQDIEEFYYDIKIKLPKEQVFDDSWFKK